MKNLTKQDARNLKKYQYLAEKFKNRNRDIYEGYLALIEMINNRQELENLIKN